MIAKILLWAYIRLVRPWSSAVIRHFSLWSVKPNEGVWLELRDLPEIEFSQRLGAVKYTPDPLGGLADYTIKDPEYFWSDSPVSRDCDDFSYQWFLWGKYNCDEAMTIVIMDGLKVSRAHYFTVLKQGQNYRLCNYSMDPARYSSVAECIKQFSKRSLVSGGVYKDLIWMIDEHWKREA